MNMHHPKANVEFTKGCGNRLKLTGIRSLEVPGPGAVAHMSLHQKLTMSKSQPDNKRRTAMEPRFFHRGTGYPSVSGDQLGGR